MPQADHPHTTTRRHLITHAPAALAVGTTALVVASGEADYETLLGYDQWLFYERRLLCRELYPGVPHADAGVPENTIAAGFHFPPWDDGPGWLKVPPPSTRALLVLKTVGVLG